MDTLTRVLQRSARRAGLPAGRNEQGITPHSLRRTCAVYLDRAGVRLATQAAWLGHAPPGGITGRYQTPTEADLIEAAAALDRVAIPGWAMAVAT